MTLTDAARSDDVAAPPTDDAAGSLERCLRRLEPALTEQRAEVASRLLTRWRERRFVALVIGEFKRGKSTLVNALVGRELVPSGLLPVTAVPTRVRSGPRARAAVRLRDGSHREIRLDEIRDHVDEARNPGNERGVASVELEVPSGPPPGVELVDVPGLGSSHAHNTESALAALPEADAALVVASVDPPVGEAELRLLRLARDAAARVDVVLNKIDYLERGELETVLDFTRRTLDQEGFSGATVWPVSARDGLEARAAGDDAAWRLSGMAALAASLERFFSEERAAALARSLAGKAALLGAEETALVEMRIAAAAESAQRLAGIAREFRARLATADRDAEEALLVFRRRFDSLFGDYAARAAEAWTGPRSRLEARLGELVSARTSEPAQAVRAAMRQAVLATVAEFVRWFAAREGQRLAASYGELCEEVGRAASERARQVWRLAAEVLPFTPPAVSPPPLAPRPRPEPPAFGSPRLLLEDLADAAARLLPRRIALRRFARQAREDADARYGIAVEQSRKTERRAYEDHFRGVLASFQEAARGTARSIEAALSTAERRSRSGEAERRSALAADQARRAELLELGALLRPIADDATRLGPTGEAGGRA